MSKCKLIGSLLLFALIMTLVPLNTFAVNRHVSSVEVDKTRVQADGDERIKFTVCLFNEDYSIPEQAKIYVASERGQIDRFYEEDADNPLPAAKYYEFVDEDSDGKLEFEVSSLVDGDVKIAVGLNKKVVDYVTDNGVSASEAEIINSKGYDFETKKVKKVSLDKVQYGNEKYNFTESGNAYKLTSSQAYPQANGSDYYEVSFFVTNEQGTPLSGKTVKFSVNNSKAIISRKSDKTDSSGIATVKVYYSDTFTGSKDIRVYAEAISNKKATVVLPFGADTNRQSIFNDEVKVYLSTPGCYVDGQLKTMVGVPFAEEDTIYVPLRFIAEIFGTEIGWDQENQEILLSNPNKQIKFKVGSRLVKDGQKTFNMLEGVPKIIGGRTYVPFCIVEYVFEAKIELLTDDANKLIGAQCKVSEN